MALVNKQQVIENDSWSVITTNELPADMLLPTISLQQVLEQTQSLPLVLPINDVIDTQGLMAEALNLISKKADKVGIWVDVTHDYKEPDVANTAQLDALLNAEKSLELIVLYVPAFVYGRAFSMAQYLRLQGYKGEIRLAGDFGLDQFAYYQRSGIDTYLVADEKITDDFFNTFADLKTAANGKSVSQLPMFA